MPPRSDYRSTRLFVDAPLAAGATAALTREQANYLLNVLRMRPGDGLLVFNGRDGEWRATIASADGKRASLSIGEMTRPQPPPSRIGLAFAPLKHARLDYMVQKAVEMGAGGLLALNTERTQVDVRNEERLRANIIEAAEQCGVLAVPEYKGAVRLDRFRRMFAADEWPAVVFCDEMADAADPVALLSGVPKEGEIWVLIGPEGGFTDSERALVAGWKNVHPISLGPRILRADTAAVAALAAVQMAVGDWRG
jgi:16S rRNA (uracil1498-N3)-methyltransferase